MVKFFPDLQTKEFYLEKDFQAIEHDLESEKVKISPPLHFPGKLLWKGLRCKKIPWLQTLPRQLGGCLM